MIKTIILLALCLIVWTKPAQAQANVVLPVEREIAGLPYEVGVGLDWSGRERWRVTDGSPDYFEPSLRQGWQVSGGIVTHNHPGEDHCVNLSVDDVQFAAYYRLAQIRAVGLENGVVSVAIITHPRRVTYAAWNRALANNRWRSWCDATAYAWRDLGIQFERIS